IGPLCIRKIVEALEIAGVQCDDGEGQHIRVSARFENLPCKKGVSDEYLRLTKVSAVGHYRIKESDKLKIPDLADLMMVIDLPQKHRAVPLVDLNFTRSNGPSPARFAAMGQHLSKSNPAVEMREVSKAFGPSLGKAFLSNILVCPEDDGTISLGFGKFHKYDRSIRYERSDFIFVTMEPSTGDGTTGKHLSRQHR
ncbi:hypothetical protein FOZ63_009289, partial [Perkinsus olseni]